MPSKFQYNDGKVIEPIQGWTCEEHMAQSAWEHMPLLH